MRSLPCDAQWCKFCPYAYRPGFTCLRSREILDDVDARNEEIRITTQRALDAYDLAHPEDFLRGLDPP